MRKSKKKLTLAIAACALTLTLAFGVTMAYMTDSEGVTNTVTVGKVNIDLEEPGYPGNDSDEVKNVIPNQEVVKDPQIENTGINDALVFLRVEIPQETYTDEDDGTWKQKKQDLFRLKDISDQWELLRTETITDADGKEKTSYIYGYKKALAKNSTTDKLFQKVQMKNAMESDLNGNVEDIVVTACAIQATDIPDIDLTPGSDGTIGKDVLDQVYEIFLKQSGDTKARPADEGNKPQDGSIGQITYELDGGTIKGAKKSYTAADYGYVPPTPTKKGYKFTGWSPESIPADSTENLTFTAEWEESTAILLRGIYLHKRMAMISDSSLGSWQASSEYGVVINNGYDRIQSIKKSNIQPSSEIMNDKLHIISSSDSKKPVYMWFDDGTLYWWSEAETVKAGHNLDYICMDFTTLTDISGLAEWDTSDVTSMKGTFSFCYALSDLKPIANWNTSNVTDFSQFINCVKRVYRGRTSSKTSKSTKSLERIYVEGDTKNYLVSALTDISPLKNWDTSSATKMPSMFDSCINIKNMTPINNWDVSNVTDFTKMFSGCMSYPDFTKRSGTWNDGTFYPTE